MKAADHLLNHIQDPRFQDEPGRLTLPGDDRLYQEFQQWEGDWKSIAHEVATRNGIAWFPDANVAILDETEPVWTALRLAALGSSVTIISGPVGTEIKEWLYEPYRNRSRAKDLREALASDSWAKSFTVSPANYRAIIGYARLFALRRLLCLQYTQDGRTILGTDPNDKSATMNAVANNFGPRAVELARKGRRDAEAEKPINILDEFHCIMAIAHALETGKETVILTADADHLEIFRKAQWFLNAHYRAWAAAKLVERGYYGRPEIELPASETRGFFLGPLTIYRRHSNRLPEALPTPYSPVKVHVVYVAPDNRVFRMASWFEQEMLGMFAVRSLTGRCTDLFGDRNIHIDLSPINTTPEGWLVGIGKDAVQTFQDERVTTVISELDMEHAIQCRERIGRPIPLTG